MAEVVRDLEIGNERGWHVHQGGREFDVMAIGVSFEISGETFAIGIAGPLPRIAQAKDRLAAALLETQAIISGMPETGGAPPAAVHRSAAGEF